jgi:hypothetical protein
MANIEEALRMVGAFTSVGATHFGLSVIDDVQDRPVSGRQLTNAHTNEIRFRLPKVLTDADQQRWSVIIRPEPPAGMMLAQLDDLDAAKVEMLKRYALVAVCTSPGNHQVWIALTGAPISKDDQREFALRLNRCVGADHRANRAGRIAGSTNYKPRHGPSFPTVEIVYLRNAHTIPCAEIAAAGLVAAPAPRPNPAPERERPARRGFPYYARVVSGARPRHDGSGPDRSLCDAMWCKWAAERGYTVEEIADGLLNVSEKAREEDAQGHKNYAIGKAKWGAKVAGGR